MSYYDETLNALDGKTIHEIYMNDEYLTFVTDEGNVTFEVEGDCCSHSEFFDFYGVANLLGQKVVAFESVSLSPGDPGYRPETFDVPSEEWEEEWEKVQVYGYRITTEHPLFGSVSAVMSFRNTSNGYYGGWMNVTKHTPFYTSEHRLLADKIGA